MDRLYSNIFAEDRVSIRRGRLLRGYKRCCNQRLYEGWLVILFCQWLQRK